MTHQTPSLRDLRQQIDDVDLAILRLIEQRLQLAEQIARCKEQLPDPPPLTDPTREQQIITRLQLATQHPLLRDEIPALFHHLMQISKQLRLQLRPSLQDDEMLSPETPPTKSRSS